MSDTILECQGLPCPQPVLECKRVIESDSPPSLSIVVDNSAARENVTRFLSTKGYSVDTTEGDGLFTLKGYREGETCTECETMTDAEIARSAETANQKITVFVGTETIGSGDDELGSKLMMNFLATLPELGEELWRIVLVNGGVRLACADNPCLEKIQALEESGVTVLVCGTCLDHFGLMEKKKAGETTNMLDVVTSLQVATKVIRP